MKSYSSRRVHFWLLILLVTGMGGSLFTGCATCYTQFKEKTARLYGHSFLQKDPRKTIRLDFSTAPSLKVKPQQTSLFEQTVSDMMQQDPRNRLVYGDETRPEQPLAVQTASASSGVDHFQRMQKNRQQGLNTMIRAGLTQVDTQDRFEGLMLFESTHHYLQIHCFAEGYNTATAAKIFDEYLVHEIEIDEMDAEDVQAGRWRNLPEIADAVQTAARRLSEKMLEALKSQQWTGFITAVEGNRIRIAAGKHVGLQPGDVFDVHDIGDIKKGLDGHRYQSLGLKTGEVRITTVAPEHAEGEIIAGTVAGPGSTVKHRH
jgi:hypothetical protein